jgi:hypothetical protein
MVNISLCAKYINRNYIRLLECRKGICMVIVNELGRLLLEQGWSESEIIDLGYGAEEKVGNENDQNDEVSPLFASKTPEEITSTTPEVTTSTSFQMLSSTIPDAEMFTEEITQTENDLSIFTEMSTEGMSDIVANMLINKNSSTTLWESVMSSGQQVTDFISEKLISVASNTREGNPEFNCSESRPESYIPSGQNYPSLSSPGTFPLSILFLFASAALLLASKYLNFIIKPRVLPFANVVSDAVLQNATTAPIVGLQIL